MVIVLGYLKQKINDLKLRNKLIISFILVVFIPVLIVGVFLTYELRRTILEDAEKQTVDNMERINDRLTELLRVPIFISNDIQFDSQFREIVNHRYETIHEVVAAYRDYNDFSNYTRLYDEIENIRFYMDNPTLINNWEIIPLSPQTQETFWYRAAQDAKGLGSWFYIDDLTKSKYLSLVQEIYFLEHKTSGVLIITVDPDELNRILSQETLPLMIVDDNNLIVATNRREFMHKKLDQVVEADPSVYLQESGIYEGEVGGETSRVLIKDVELENIQNHLKVVSILTNDSVVKNANAFSKMGLYVILLSVIVAMVLIYYFSKLLSNRLSILSYSVNEVGKGNFDTPIIIDGKDEIGQLSQQLQLMVLNTKELIEEVHDSNRQKSLLENKQNEIKFKMMASQINPHFLFNALESIRMKAHLKGEREIAQVVKMLGKLMRKSIEVGSGKVNLKSEMDIVRSYLEIQKFRHGDRLSYTLYMDPLAEKFSIFPLIIQPLVENAVIHGLENSEAGGHVCVKTKLIEAGLVVEVIDNGTGINDQRKAEIYKVLNETEEKEDNRIGLRNVHQRLELSYGKESGLKIESEPGRGTRIHFFIPIGGENLV